MKTRFLASVFHLLASAMIAVLAAALVFFLWYPAPLHVAVGVTKIFLLLLAIDVITGPLLTFVVYAPGKKTLRFDLTVIVFLQLGALTYGMWTVAEGRPAWLVFNTDRVDMVQAYELDTRRLHETLPAYRSPPWFGPKWVAALPPDDPEANNTLTFESVFAGVDLPQRADLYRPLAGEAAAAMVARARLLDELLRYNPEPSVAEVRRRWPAADAFLPMMARGKPMTVLINREAAAVVAVVDLQPWE